MLAEILAKVAQVTETAVVSGSLSCQCFALGPSIFRCCWRLRPERVLSNGHKSLWSVLLSPSKQGVWNFVIAYGGFLFSVSRMVPTAAAAV